jgi:hypothetical protein
MAPRPTGGAELAEMAVVSELLFAVVASDMVEGRVREADIVVILTNYTMFLLD